MVNTSRANYGYLQFTTGAARDCIRSLSNNGSIVQKVILTGSQPQIRIKPDESVERLGNPITGKRGDVPVHEVELHNCTVYWAAKGN